MVNLIVSYDENRVIGHMGLRPWQLPTDVQMARERTAGNVLLMGRQTWQSMARSRGREGRLYVPGCVTVVVTSDPTRFSAILGALEESEQRYLFFQSPDRVADMLRRSGGLAIGPTGAPCDYYVVGGGLTYAWALSTGLVDRVYATEVKGKHEGDRLFPPLPPGYEADDWDVHPGFTVVRYQRRAATPPGQGSEGAV